MKNLKFELIIAYYKRPKIVLNALNSIKNLNYDNWHLSFIDDSGDDSFGETLFKQGFSREKISYIPIMMSDEEKIKIGGSLHGKYINDVIKNTHSDIIIIICDDDALFKNYLNDLNEFYNNNLNEVWTYSHVKFYNPDTESYIDANDIPKNPNLNTSNLNDYRSRIYPPCRVDSCQVSFRKKAFIESNQWYPYPQTKDLDRSIFEKFSLFWGTCPFSGFYGQYKGWFENQLGYRHKVKNTDYLKNENLYK